MGRSPDQLKGHGGLSRRDFFGLSRNTARGLSAVTLGNFIDQAKIPGSEIPQRMEFEQVTTYARPDTTGLFPYGREKKISSDGFVTPVIPSPAEVSVRLVPKGLKRVEASKTAESVDGGTRHEFNGEPQVVTEGMPLGFDYSDCGVVYKGIVGASLLEKSGGFDLKGPGVGRGEILSKRYGLSEGAYLFYGVQAPLAGSNRSPAGGIWTRTASTLESNMGGVNYLSTPEDGWVYTSVQAFPLQNGMTVFAATGFREGGDSRRKNIQIMMQGRDGNPVGSPETINLPPGKFSDTVSDIVDVSDNTGAHFVVIGSSFDDLGGGRIGQSDIFTQPIQIDKDGRLDFGKRRNLLELPSNQYFARMVYSETYRSWLLVYQDNTIYDRDPQNGRVRIMTEGFAYNSGDQRFNEITPGRRSEASTTWSSFNTLSDVVILPDASIVIAAGRYDMPLTSRPFSEAWINFVGYPVYDRLAIGPRDKDAIDSYPKIAKLGGDRWMGVCWHDSRTYVPGKGMVGGVNTQLQSFKGHNYDGGRIVVSHSDGIPELVMGPSSVDGKSKNYGVLLRSTDPILQRMKCTIR